MTMAGDEGSTRESKVEKLSFAQFQFAMIKYAKSIQGENFAGNAYYLQEECWRENYEDGDTPEEAVLHDMEAWD